jgi:hypothetical protein
MEMFGRALVLRRIAASHMAPFQAQPQMDPRTAGLDAVFERWVLADLNLICFKWLQALGQGSSSGRTGSGLFCSFQASSVPLRQVRAGLICALQKFQYS